MTNKRQTTIINYIFYKEIFNMKKIITFGILLLTFINSFWVFSIYVEETTITLKPWLNSVSTPWLLKWISFSNWGDNISFVTLENQKRKAVSITNEKVKQTLSPLTWFIVRNDTSDDVTMTLSYENNIEEPWFIKNLNNGRNLLWITTKYNPFNNITNAETTSILDLTDRGTNKIIAWNNFQTANNFTLWKSYWVFINQTDDWSWLYLWENNNEKLNWFTESECQEICEDDDENCPDTCRTWILSNNTINNTRILANDDTKQTVYIGTFTANKYLKINNFTVYWDNEIPEWDKIKLYLYVNNEEKYKITLDYTNSYYETISWPEFKIKTWNNVQITVKAKYVWTTTDTNYNYKFKLLWEDVNTIFYKINSQNIILDITWSSDSGIIINEKFEQAYNRATSKWILNNQIISYEKLNDNIDNTELANFINNYSKTILNRKKDTTKNCSFINTESLTELQNNVALESCQLWLIQEDDGIDFNNQSDLSTFSILLSRALRNDRYNWWNYLNALQVAWIIKDTASPEDNQLKWDILVALMNSEWKNEYRRVENSYNFLMNDFNAVEDIYSNIRTSDWDRVIFIVRHSARINNCWSEWWLTDTGIELARWVWEKLKWAPFEDTSTDFYGSSTVKRTVQTSYYVGESRGSEVLESIINDDLRNDYSFVNHSSSIHNIVYWNYFSDAAINSIWDINHLYENNKDIVNEKAHYSINTLCNMTDWHPFSWITTHDWYTLPITERATNESISFSQSQSERPNFMQWVAVIVHPYWWWEIYPAKSLETGKIDVNLNPGC